MALTESKRRANNKYIAANMKVLGCKVRKDYAETAHAAAAAAGTTVNAVMKSALDALISGVEAVPASILTPEALEAASSAAEADGQTVSDWITGAIKSQAQRDELRRKLQK